MLRAATSILLDKKTNFPVYQFAFFQLSISNQSMLFTWSFYVGIIPICPLDCSKNSVISIFSLLYCIFREIDVFITRETFSRNFFRVRVKFFNFHSVRVLYVFVCVCILCECVVLLVVCKCSVMKGSVIYGVVNVIWHTETDSLSARAKNTINAVVDHHL